MDGECQVVPWITLMKVQGEPKWGSLLNKSPTTQPFSLLGFSALNALGSRVKIPNVAGQVETHDRSASTPLTIAPQGTTHAETGPTWGCFHYVTGADNASQYWTNFSLFIGKTNTRPSLSLMTTTEMYLVFLKRYCTVI